VQRWLILGVAELLAALVLIAVAPVFFNSNAPLIGFLIWLLVPCLLLGSVLYVIVQVIDAFKARRILVSRFPDYAYLGAIDFLELPSTVVKNHLEILEIMREDPDLRLDSSPIDLLRRAKKR